HPLPIYTLFPYTTLFRSFENTFREVFFHRGWQLENEEVEEDRQLLPILNAVGQDRGEEVVRAGEHLRLSLEVDLPVLVEVVHVRSEEHTSELQSPYDLVC